jgi:predicted GH43/DUF377 family glycosyl hydrolase
MSMFKWLKQGKLFDPQDRQGTGWMHEFAQSPSALVMDEWVRVYFCTRPKPDAQGMYLSYLAYVDLDRQNLHQVLRVCERPLLELGKRGTFDEFGTNPISVIRDGEEIRVYYAGWTRCESVPVNGAIGIAISRDGGESFVRLGDGPVISYSPDEPFMMGSPRIRKFDRRWYLWYVSGKVWLKTGDKPEPVYKIRMAFSEDGINWVKHGKNLLEDRLGENECQACPDVTFWGGRYHMFYSYRHSHNYKTNEGGYRIGYAVSDDMVHWQRRDEMAGMEVSAAGWDSEMVNYPHVFTLDGETYMLYQGNGMGRTGFGFAKLLSPSDWDCR